ncbi:MAG: DUF4185 domain-containing protein [Protaetiibacter sp.]
MARKSAFTPAISGALAAVTLVSCSGPRVSSDPELPFVLTGVTDIEQVGQITGAEGPGDTTQWAVNFTDLGSMFEHDGKMWFVFGDTFGERDADFTGGGGSFWRSNVMGWTTDTTPADGITIEGMVVDDIGLAKELLPSNKVDNDEMTVIPTHGFSTGDAMYLHWMSVRHWGVPSEWEVNESGLARSTDDGQSWEVLDSPRWGGESGFVQISPYRVGDELYVWGITHGRFSGVHLARVPITQVEDAGAWRYLTGVVDGEPQWGENPDDATIIVDDTVGELSVVWNDYLDRWLMSYLDPTDGIVLREGITPWGPWSDEFQLLGPAEVPGPYAPFMNAKYTEDGGRVIYFTLSIWDPYNVFWYRAELQSD